MKRIYLAESLVDGQLVADWLTGNGIPCELFNRNATGALGELPVSGPEVWLHRDADSARASKLIDESIFSETCGEQTCARCGEASPTGFDICWQCQHALPRS